MWHVIARNKVLNDEKLHEEYKERARVRYYLHPVYEQKSKENNSESVKNATNHYTLWTTEDIQYLETHMNDSCAELSKVSGRSIYSVKARKQAIRGTLKM